MTIWYILPPQGYTDSQELSIIGRPSHPIFLPPQGYEEGGIAAIDDEDYQIGLDRTHTDFLIGPTKDAVDFKVII